jgi:hypothetical protein
MDRERIARSTNRAETFFLLRWRPRCHTDLCLHEFAGAADRRGARALLAHVARSTPIRAANGSHQSHSMALANDAPVPEAEPQMRYFDDAIDLARSGTYGTESAVLAELKEFLRPYRGAAT